MAIESTHQVTEYEKGFDAGYKAGMQKVADWVKSNSFDNSMNHSRCALTFYTKNYLDFLKENGLEGK